MAELPFLERMEQSGNLVYKGYRALVIPAFNLYAFVAETALVAFIFGMAGSHGTPLWLVVLGVGTGERPRRIRLRTSIGPVSGA